LLKIGLTGGIGSGKSTVAAIFETLGVPVIYADAIAKKIMHEDDKIITAIKELFGETCYQSGKLNKQYIASIIFKNPTYLEKLNNIVHPATIEYSKKWMSEQHSPYSIKEAALIFESHSEKELDYVIGVYSPLEIRINRTMQRDKLSHSEVEQRISQQMNEEEKMLRCDFIITNDEQISLIAQVLELHKNLIGLANASSTIN